MNRWRCGSLGWVTAAALWAVPALSLAAPDPATVEHWLETEIETSRGLPEFGPVMVHWVREDHGYPDSQEMSRLSAEVPGHPDHPERFAYEEYVRHQQGQPTLLPRHAWILNEGTWRLSEDLLGPGFKPGSYWDKVVTPHHAFSLSHDSLTVMAPTEGYPPGQNLASLTGEIAADLNLFLSGGLSLIEPNSRIEWVTAESPDRWAARVRPAPTSAWMLEVRGRWDADAARGFVDSVSRRRETGGAPARVGIAEDWVLDPTLQRWLATRVSTFDEADRLKFVFRWVEAEPLSNEQFEAVFVTPSADRPDAVRGPLHVKVTSDMQTGEQTIHLPDGRDVQQPIDATALSPHAGSSTRLRAAGWAASAGVVLLLVWLRFRRARNRTRTGSV